MRIFQIPGLLLMPAIFWAFATQPNSSLFHLGSMDITWMHLGIFICGLCTVSQFSFWGNYLPYVYPVHLRGTGESFAANIGGRLIGTSFAAVTSFVATAPWVPGGIPPAKIAYTAAGVALFVYLVGSIACFWLPEPNKVGRTERIREERRGQKTTALAWMPAFASLARLSSRLVFPCHDLEIARIADGRDQVAVDGLFHGTARFVRVRTVGKAAAGHERAELEKSPQPPRDARPTDPSGECPACRPPSRQIRAGAARPSGSCDGPSGSRHSPCRFPAAGWAARH